MPIVDISEQDARVLRRFAALQFPGSIENAGTRNPVHILQAWREDDSHKIPVEDYHSGCYLFYDAARFDDPSAMTERILGLTPERPFDLDKKNLAQWLAEDCDIDPDDIECYEPEGHWDDLGFSLVRQDMMKLRRDLSNHIFGPSRIYSSCAEAFDRHSGDLENTMGILFRLGSRLLRDFLNEKLEGLHREDHIPWSHSAVRQGYRDHPDTPFTAWHTVLDRNGDPVWSVSVICAGHDNPAHKDGLLARIPSLYLEDLENGRAKMVPWPFAEDPCLDALAPKVFCTDAYAIDPFHRAFAYALYSDCVDKPEA